MKIIALTGPKTVGKSTIAHQLVDDCFYYTKIVSFADPIREMLRTMGVADEYLTDPNLKETPIPGINQSARHLMQTLGTEWGRNIINNQIWLWAMDRVVEKAERSKLSAIIIDDCRFENEADWVHQNGGIVCRVHRDGYEYGSDTHSSEKPICLSKIDLHCDGSDKRVTAQLILDVVDLHMQYL